MFCHSERPEEAKNLVRGMQELCHAKNETLRSAQSDRKAIIGPFTTFVFTKYPVVKTP